MADHPMTSRTPAGGAEGRKLDRWSGVVVDGPRCQEAILSWFGGLGSPGDVVLHAETYELDDGTITKLRALVRRRSGTLREVFRRNNKANTVYGSKLPSADLLKRAKDRGVIA